MIENLWEEHGEGALSGTHYTLYCDLLESIGLPRDPLLSSANAETIEFIEKQEQLAKQDVFGGLGAFCYANEYLTIAEFRPIWRAIEDEFPAANVRFFEENVRVDSRHARQTEDVIERLADSDRDLMAVERGAKEALAARSRFYDALMSK
jgi:pyrroloquinoline-quinone synthase